MNIIVTGASRGIGFETVKVFTKKGNHHIIALARSGDKLEKLKSVCKEFNGNSKVIPIVFDLRNNDHNALLALIADHFKHVDILINNAGHLVNKEFEKIDIETAKNIFDVNFFSPANLIRTLLPFMTKSSNTHIVNISSMGGYQGSQKFPGLNYYSSSKGALAILTECLALELKDKNISINCLAIGSAQTQMLAEAFPGYKAPITAEEMAEYIADFALNGHKVYNGKILPVSLTTP